MQKSIPPVVLVALGLLVGLVHLEFLAGLVWLAFHGFVVGLVGPGLLAALGLPVDLAVLVVHSLPGSLDSVDRSVLVAAGLVELLGRSTKEMAHLKHLITN